MAAATTGKSSPALKVFVSYARRDLAVADAIVAALEQRNFETIIDRRDLPFGEEWHKELSDFLRACDTVLCLVSGGSLSSKMCNWETGEATRLGKRIVPVVIQPVDFAVLPEAISKIQLLPAEGVFDLGQHLDALVAVLNTDRAWLKEATRIADRAGRWLASGQSADHLLRGHALGDAERWLEKRPAAAAPPSQDQLSFILASQRAVRRRRGLLSAGLACGLLVAISLAGYAFVQRGEAIAARNDERDARRAEEVQRKDAEAQRDTAKERLQLARNTSETLVSFIAKDLRKVQGIQTGTLKRLLNAARASFEGLSSAAGDDPTFQHSRATMMSEFGEAYLKAGDTQAAARSYSESLAIFRDLAAKDPGAIAWQRGIADDIDYLGVVHQKQGKLPEAHDAFRTALAIRTGLAAREPDNPDSHRDLAASHYNLGEVMLPQGKPNEALESHRSALHAIVRALALAPGDDSDLQLRRSKILISLGTVYQDLRRNQERLDANLTSLAIRQRLVEKDPDNVEWLRMLSWAYTWVAGSYEDLERWQEALDNYRECRILREKLVRGDPGNRRAQYDLAWAYHYTGNVLRVQGKLDDAALQYEEAHKIRLELTAADEDNATWRKDLALSLISLGDVADKQQRPQLALDRLDAARQILDQLIRKSPENVDWPLTLSRVHAMTGKLFKTGGNLDGALRSYEQCRVIRRHLLEGAPANIEFATSAATCEFLVAEVQQRRGDTAEALTHYRESQALRRAALDLDPANAEIKRELDAVETAIRALEPMQVSK